MNIVLDFCAFWIFIRFFLIQLSFWYTKFSAFLIVENLGIVTITPSTGLILIEIFFALLLFLNFISISDSFAKAKENIIKNLNTLNWSEGFYRRDIGYKVIK